MLMTGVVLAGCQAVLIVTRSGVLRRQDIQRKNRSQSGKGKRGGGEKDGEEKLETGDTRSSTVSRV